MRINSIKINNFGSYEGTTFFDTHMSNTKKNIILIGGKNGAGKTTLFTAVRVGIYGCRAYGYQSINPFYIRNIYKLLNNKSKKNLPAEAYVEIDFSINNGIEFDRYVLKRIWSSTKVSSVSEEVILSKNNEQLSKSGIADFEKYLLQVIPPDLFDLFFFDGEKIADFFLDEGGNRRFKNAFMTLCGYDTFEIMSRNFHRIYSENAEKQEVLESYFITKQNLLQFNSAVEDMNHRILETQHAIDSTSSSISALDNGYKKSGGVTEKEWSQKIEAIALEEQKREVWNARIKKTANEILPFLILEKQLNEVEQLVHLEDDVTAEENFYERLQKPEILKLFYQAAKSNNISPETNEIEKLINTVVQLKPKTEQNKEKILSLSPDQKARVLYQISSIKQFDKNEISETVKKIKDSVRDSQKLRQEIDYCNIEVVQEYTAKRKNLLIEKERLEQELIFLEENLEILIQQLSMGEQEFEKAKKTYEDILKQESINDISTKAIMMLDKLQDKLYEKQVEKLTNRFKTEINLLMRKNHFIDDVYIDYKFGIHIYQTVSYTGRQVAKILKDHTFDQIEILYGTRTLEKIKKFNPTSRRASLIEAIKLEKTIKLPIEIDINSLSNGEKQIFIMALYKSLMQLCNHEVPFIIDTPFARIDSEHRSNIVKYFFTQLKGQVFILSTNEEINTKHLIELNNKILGTYLLKNDNNECTKVSHNQYF